MNKCPNCGEMHESVVCHACGYRDVGLEEHLASEKQKADQADKEYCEYIDAQRAKEQEEDNRMVSLHLCAMELYELQGALCKLPKSEILDIVLDKVGILVESLQK